MFQIAFYKDKEGSLWELRPLKNRIFFFCWKDDIFVLLHHFIKKSQKTPEKEIEKARLRQKDFLKREGKRDEKRVSSSEKEQILFEASLIGKMVAAREKSGLSQRELARLSGVKQPAIARMESMRATPQIDTLLKVLNPLGYTIEIVPLKNGPKAAEA